MDTNFKRGAAAAAFAATLLGNILFVLAGIAAAPIAHAASGQCRWEGGPGAAGGYAYCEAEDCIGNGGHAQCTKATGAAATPFGDSEVGPDKWAYHMCDSLQPQIANDAKWCAAAGGEWAVIGGQGRCINMPDDILGGGGTITNSESRAASISDGWVARKYSGCSTSLVSDTGWGATLSSSFCWSGSTSYKGEIPVSDLRRRVYDHCSGTVSVYLLRNRSAKCPPTYKSRTSGGVLQCYKPQESVCSIGNPVSPYSGEKTQTEVDYRPGAFGNLEFVRRYSSSGYYRPSGMTVTPALPAGGLLDTDHWRHNYDRRLYLIDGNAEISAIAHRHDNTLFVFDLAGQERSNRSGAGNRLTAGPAGSWTLTLADRSVERYDNNGRLQSIQAPGGTVTTLLYDAAGLLSLVTDAFGHQLQLGYNSDGQLISVTLPDNGVVQFSYDNWQRLSSVTYPDNTERRYLYEDARHRWLLTGLVDENDQRFATYEYDDEGRAVVSEHAGADRLEFNYGATTQVRDARGMSREYSFVSAAGIYKTAGLSAPGSDCGVIKSSTFDSAGDLALRTDFNDNQTSYSYDPQRHLELSRTEAYGTALARTVTTDWHPSWRLPMQIAEPGRSTAFTYDGSGNLLTRSVTDTETGQTRTWSYSYDSFGRMLTADGPRTDVSDVVTYSYHACASGNECGQLATVTNAAGHVTSFLAYDAHGRPLSITDPNGAVTTLAYDARQRLIATQTAGETVSYGYYPTGLLRRVTAADGSFIEYGYDAAHRLTDLTDGEGNAIHYTLNAAGDRLQEDVRDVTGTLSRTRSRIFNALGWLDFEIGAAGQTLGYTQDAMGNVENVTDPKYRLTTTTYDALNRIQTVTDPIGGVLEYTYNERDELIEIADPRNVSTSYLYNAFGDLRRLTSPDTGISQFLHDEAGNMRQATDARGRVQTRHYDALNRVTQVSYADQTVDYSYDQGANALGRLSGLTDGSGSTQWFYDALGRIVGKQQTSGGVTRTVGYTFDSSGRLSQIATPSGQLIGYTYIDGKIASISINSSLLLDNLLYQPFGPTRGWRWANGTYTVREYDTDAQLTTIDSAGFSSYEYDTDGSIRSRSDEVEPPMTFGEGTTAFTVATDSNRLLSSTGQNARTYSYDAAGNITGDGIATFTYNDAGRMVSAGKSGVTATYVYNALGQRVSKTIAGAATYFVYDEAGHLLGEYGTGGTLIQETVWLDDIPVATLRPNGSGGVAIYYVHTDNLNTPRKISRPSDNTIVWRWDSDPFGTTAANQDPDGDAMPFAYNLRFPGQYYDSETELHYNYFRDYDPAVGRYTQSDPMLQPNRLITNELAFYVPLILQWPQWLQPYSYVTAKPLSEIDPYGLGLWGIIKCMWYGSKMEKYADQCQGECPNDMMGQLNFMRKYQASFLDDAMLKCTCSKAEAAGDKDLCAKFFATCITSPFGGPMPKPSK